MILIGAAIYSAVIIFWASVSRFIEPENKAVAVAFINSVGSVGGYCSPLMFAEIEKLTDDIKISLFMGAGAAFFLAVMLLQFLPWRKSN